MNTANKITLIRIALIPVFLFFFLTDFVPYSHYIAVAVFVIASITDQLDGYIARKYNQITDFGKFIDPLADKILVISALIAMIEYKMLSSIPVIIIISREFIVTGLRIVAISSGKVIAAAFSGKLKTVMQIIMTVYLMIMRDLYPAFPLLDIFGQIIIWATVAITLYSGAEYLIKNKDVIDYRK